MEAQEPHLDRIDRDLLRALSQDARASGSALAAAVGVSESTISLRLRKLRQSGVVRGYRPHLDPSKLGATLQAFIAVRLTSHHRADIDSFRTQAPSWRGVLAMYHVAGENDYLLRVAARDAGELRDFVLTYLATHPAVQHTETSLIFEHVEGTGWQDLV